MGYVGRMLMIGIMLGSAAGLGLGRLGQSMLFEVDGFDLRILMGAAGIVSVTLLLAALLPAMRAANVNPVQAG